MEVAALLLSTDLLLSVGTRTLREPADGERDPAFPLATLVALDSRVPATTADGRLGANRLSPTLEWLGEACPGGFAEAVVVPAVSARRLPAGVDPAEAVLTEPLAVVVCALDQVPRVPAEGARGTGRWCAWWPSPTDPAPSCPAASSNGA